MVGAIAATSKGLMAELRLARIERPIRRFREHAARTCAEELARMTWTEEARHGHAGRSRDFREAELNPLRWVRLV
jgi:hypothetical protein